MLSRVADAVHWMSRYIERAENIARFVDVNEHLTLDLPGDDGRQWRALVVATGDDGLFLKRFGSFDRDRVVRFLTLDPEYPSSIWSCLRAARENARSVREIISRDMWEQTNRAYLDVKEAAGRPDAVYADPEPFLQMVKEACHRIHGSTQVTMTHNDAWHFMQMGRLLERADKTSRILDVKYFLLAPVGGVTEGEEEGMPLALRPVGEARQAQSSGSASGEGILSFGPTRYGSEEHRRGTFDGSERPGLYANDYEPLQDSENAESSSAGTAEDDLQWSALLQSVSALEMYRQRHGRIHPARVIDFLLFDHQFPRAIRYCVNLAEKALHALDAGGGAHFPRNAVERRLGRLRADLEFAEVNDVLSAGVHRWVDDFQTKLNGVGSAMHETFFELGPPPAPPGRLKGA